MNHHNTTRKLGRETKQRTALLRSLAISLILKEKIKTTEAKAKELRPFIEKIVTKGKEGTLTSRRMVSSRLGSGGVSATKKVFDVIAPKYEEREGGYTRVVKVSNRQNDGSRIAIIEFV
ncbi:50S ribosomal protein L17 [Patescibacteria group bacterium]|nr:50S ribosomal protein L17 [Patescibacteria group bacterium]MCG2694571.1 50S ribosomal protein L17 [Candidatus Parcubacteria bacterium]